MKVLTAEVHMRVRAKSGNTTILRVYMGRLMLLAIALSAPFVIADDTEQSTDPQGIAVPNPFSLPPKGAIRIVYASGLQTCGLEGPVRMFGRQPVKLYDSECHIIKVDEDDTHGFGVRGQGADADAIAVVFSCHAEGSLGPLRGSTCAELAEALGIIVRCQQRWSPAPDLPIVIYVESPTVTAHTDQPGERPPTNEFPGGFVRMPTTFPVFRSQADRLVTMGRFTVIFALDAQEGADAEVKFSLNPVGEMRNGGAAIDDRRIAQILRTAPSRQGLLTMTLSPGNEDQMSLETLGVAVARILNAGANSLPKGDRIVLYIRSGALLRESNRLGSKSRAQ